MFNQSHMCALNSPSSFLTRLNAHDIAVSLYIQQLFTQTTFVRKLHFRKVYEGVVTVMYSKYNFNQCLFAVFVSLRCDLWPLYDRTVAMFIRHPPVESNVKHSTRKYNTTRPCVIYFSRDRSRPRVQRREKARTR